MAERVKALMTREDESLGRCVGSSLQVDKVIVGVWNDLGCWSAERFEV